MKKVTIIGVTDAELANLLLPALAHLRANFMVEIMEEPPAPKPTKLKPEVVAELDAKTYSTPFKHPEGKTIEHFIRQLLQERDAATRNQLIDYCVSKGYKPGAVTARIMQLAGSRVIYISDDGFFRFVQQAEQPQAVPKPSNHVEH